MPVTTIYDLPQVVRLGTDSGSQYMNHPVNRTDLIVVQNVRNDIQILLRDIDNKPVVFTDGSTLSLHVVDRKAALVLTTLPLTLIDPVKARYQGTLLAADVAAWDLGSYTYYVTRTDPTMVETLVFTDRGRTEIGVLTLRAGPIPTLPASQTLLLDDLLTRGGYLYSGALPGSSQIANDAGVQTFALTGNRFVGDVTAQGSLDAMPSSDDDQWFDLTTTSYNNLTGTAGLTVEGNLTWIRLKISNRTPQPAEGFEVDESPAAGLVKITYRNR